MTYAPNGAPPAWLHNLLIEGLQLLLVLRLKDTPASDTLVPVANVWIDVLWHSPTRWDEAADTPRLRAAFRALGIKADRWPAPAQLLRELPGRVSPPALPAPRPDPAKARAGLAQLAQLSAQLRTRPAPKGYAAQAINERLQQEAQANPTPNQEAAP
jgi:hypothetical protein